jgi:hypothetical protein
MLKKIKEFFKVLFLIAFLPFELSKGKKRRVKKQIKSYFFRSVFEV